MVMKVDYSKYAGICHRAVENDEMFGSFKRHPTYTQMLEHVTYEYGLDYLGEIKKDNGWLLSHINKFITNDNIGNPTRFWYEELGFYISPTTIRYIKVLSDLLTLFGDMNGMDIVEIGVGYGGQCKIISDIVNFKSYTLIDLPPIIALADKCLHRQGVKDFISRSIDNSTQVHYDLCISNYAFTEIGRGYQEFYAENIINNSDMGYITCNYFGLMNADEALTETEVLAMKPNGVKIPEIPLTSPHNFIYTWSKI